MSEYFTWAHKPIDLVAMADGLEEVGLEAALGDQHTAKQTAFIWFGLGWLDTYHKVDFHACVLGGSDMRGMEIRLIRMSPPNEGTLPGIKSEWDKP